MVCLIGSGSSATVFIWAHHEGADAAVVSLFSLFHDSRRINDFEDPGHGARGAHLAGEYFSDGLLSVSESQFRLLAYACENHTDETYSTDITVGCCWDADRLDLTRIGVPPDPDMLNTVEAKAVAETCDFSPVEAFIYDPTKS
jgi:uncharacterized protein